MRSRRTLICILICASLIVLIPIHSAKAQEYFEYHIEIRSDGTAHWIIKQFSSVYAPSVPWEVLQQKISALVESAQNATHRPMDIDGNSMQISTSIFAESKTTEYSFVWRNFSIVEGEEIKCGDVFTVNYFFDQLFGDAALQVSYPKNFTVQSVYPSPYEQQDEEHTMKWVRTQELVGDGTSIVLKYQPELAIDTQIATIGGLLVTAAIVVSMLFYTLRKRHSPTKISRIVPQEPLALAIDTEEGKVLKLLKSKGGVMRQSELTEQLRFSKAKTSQLLSQLEAEGKLSRFKKGRDKIVTLKQVEGE